jgi:hypothetical protein
LAELEERGIGSTWDIGHVPKRNLVGSHSPPPLVAFSGPSRSFAGEVLLTVSHRASFRMVHFTGSGLDTYMEAAGGVVSHPIPLGSY